MEANSDVMGDSISAFEGGEFPISVHRSSPDRFVFIERGNSDAWISTDYTITLNR